MEIVMVKVPKGTKAKLRKLNPNMSELIREQIERLLEHKLPGSALEKAGDLVGSIKGGPPNMATSKEYLKRYGKKDSA